MLAGRAWIPCGFCTVTCRSCHERPLLTLPLPLLLLLLLLLEWCESNVVVACRECWNIIGRIPRRPVLLAAGRHQGTAPPVQSLLETAAGSARLRALLMEIRRRGRV
jgi:hypothetical protein